jgi:hypothetical protein
MGGPGYARLMSHHRKPDATRDGYIAILPYLDAHWVTGRAASVRMPQTMSIAPPSPT